MDRERYLRDGLFSAGGDACKDIANQINGAYPIDEIDEFINSMPNEKRPELWRKRSSEDIVRDGFTTGCTDRGLVFVTLCRMKGFPAVYVETLEEDFLRNPTEGKTNGHIFSDVYYWKGFFDNGHWIPRDPGYGEAEKHGNRPTIYIRGPKFKRVRYVELGKGLDFSEIDLYGLDDAGVIVPKASLLTVKDIKKFVDKVRLPPTP